MTGQNSMNQRRLTRSALALGLLGGALAASPARAQQQGGQGFEALQRRLDLNLDGKVDESEFPRGRAAFRRLDRDRDGFLTAADFGPRAGAQPRPKTPTSPDMGAGPRGVTPEEAAFFEGKVRPVLSLYCYSCHAETSKRLKGELKVDSLQALLRGGATGPAIVPGDADESPLIHAIRYDDPSLQMPPQKKLAEVEIRYLEEWVAMGAPWPGAAVASSEDVESPAMSDSSEVAEHSLDREIDIEEGRKFWSFQPVARPTPPSTENAKWAWSDLDSFLLAAMERAGVAPVADADRRTWLRRVSFDLTGLPPTPDEARAFEADTSPDAFETVVDRLLASPGFGERFGRHWLDVARYAESSGKESNVLYPHAWRYRDWVIDAFHADMPYDQFLQKQLAGDLLPATNDDERAWNQIATGYLAIGSKGHNERDLRKFSLDMVDEQIDTFTQGMLGVTLSCARCHDHKFDPFPIEDYYSVAGIFLSTETRFGTQRSPGNNQASSLLELPAGASVPNGPAMDPGLRALLVRGQERAQSVLERAREQRAAGGDTKQAERNAVDAQRERAQREQNALLEDLLGRFDERGRALPSNRLAMGVVEGQARDIVVLERGELDRPREVAPRGVPQVLRTGAASEAKITAGSGRAELAAWVASDQNPLTARVWVNRVWLHIFGTGLVRTPDNFGAGGLAPDHPELLDWLASELVANGWSTKALVRQMVLSHAYRLDSRDVARHSQRDPEVLTRWRMPEQRLEAEAIRDALLMVSGALAPERPVGSPTGALEGALRRDEFTDLLTRERPVRSVYLPSLRGHVVDALDVFDTPDGSFVTGAREATNVATQALFLMNDEDVLAHADRFAARLLALEGDDAARVEAAFELAFGRAPSAVEHKAVRAFLADYEGLVEAPKRPTTEPGSARPRRPGRQGRQPEGGADTPRSRPNDRSASAPQDPRRAAWSAFAQSLFQSAEFRTIG